MLWGRAGKAEARDPYQFGLVPSGRVERFSREKYLLTRSSWSTEPVHRHFGVRISRCSDFGEDIRVFKKLKARLEGLQAYFQFLFSSSPDEG